ncbi:MAG: bifunctional phosphopantothenoylcysteine decarboxylase/phosphopantothenate--cysteine ligase CoaBC [Clostridiales bacterium]|jgi:phosphopantothenoylcysteine decarboxylase/phosphopantothenate--cysteine ligase|nr:bifunctional phosphopantothenoylcysteine decarboxylase/phosphopantothenate--cysteine ligase CoaBC [Clostridiales bacterium]
MELKGKTVVLGVTGGIAAYKACGIVRLLKKRGADVIVAMTKNAAAFVTPLTFETLSNNRVTVDTFDRGFVHEVEHIALSARADLFLVAPCTANFIGKLRAGIADDFLSTTAMAMTCPILLAPAMNTNMLHSAAVRDNMRVLAERGLSFVSAGTGLLACGVVGAGRLADPKDIVDAAQRLLLPLRDYENKTVLITAGATVQPIDPVRFITNRSSGKMGAALAFAALRRGARVILIAGKTSVELPQNAELIRVETTDDMYEAVMDNLARADIVIKAAAPSDYRAEVSAQKLKAERLTLRLTKNRDIAAAVGEKKRDKKLVIFSAETENLLENAADKRTAKRADMVVANDVTQAGAGFDTDTNIVTVITAKGAEPLEKMSKTALADMLLDRIAAL